MNRRNAYFVVEAALVLPLVMSAMMMGIYLFCYQYDRCLLEQDMGILMIWSSAIATENAGESGEIKENLQARASDINLEKYAAWKMTTVDIKLEKNDISLTGRGELAFPITGWNRWNDDNLWEAGVHYKCDRLSPVFYIRQYRKLQGMFQDEEDQVSDLENENVSVH